VSFGERSPKHDASR